MEKLMKTGNGEKGEKRSDIRVRKLTKIPGEDVFYIRIPAKWLREIGVKERVITVKGEDFIIIVSADREDLTGPLTEWLIEKMKKERGRSD